MQLEIKYKPLADLIPYARNSRTHSEAQVKQIASSIREFGFNSPILISTGNDIVAGHGRALAAEKLGLDLVPTIELGHLSDTQRRAYVLADNRLAENSGWDMEMLKAEIAELDEHDFDISMLGFGDYLVEEDKSETENDEIEPEPEVKFSEFIGEENNYIVLIFNNEIDWLAAKERFNLKTVTSKRANGKPWSSGIGRVVDGGKFLSEEK